MRWLLMLGAGLEYDGALDAALARLDALGAVRPLTATRITDAHDGSARRYRNRVVELEHPGPRDALVPGLKRIEQALGRGTRPGVPLDIDLLARDDGAGWQPDARALAKREFDSGHVRQLLAEAGLDALITQAATHG